MIITCPSCAARYNVADSAVPATGRKVKCAACAHQWLQMPDGLTQAVASQAETGAETASESETAQTAATAAPAKVKAGKKGFAFPRFKLPGRSGKKPLPAHEQMRQRVHGRIKGGQRLAAGGAWALSAGLVVAGLVAAVSNRTTIVRAWPQSATAFSAIGFPANLYGVDITGVQVAAGRDARGPRIVVGGVLESVSRTPEPVAYLRVALVDEKGVEKTSWMVDPGITELAPGQSHRFQTIKRDPPRGELTAIVTFGEPPPQAPRPEPEPPAGPSGLLGAGEKAPHSADEALQARLKQDGHGPAVGR